MSPNSETVVTEKVIEVTPYRAQDARDLKLTERAAASLQGLGDLDAVWVQYETLGPAWTLRVDDEIVGCCGLIFMWPKPIPKVAHAWLLPSPLLAQYPLTAVKAIVTRFRELIDQYDLVRVQLEVQADFEAGNRFVQWLGFEPDGRPDAPGLMPCYGPNGEDYVRYALIRRPCARQVGLDGGP